MKFHHREMMIDWRKPSSFYLRWYFISRSILGVLELLVRSSGPRLMERVKRNEAKHGGGLNHNDEERLSGSLDHLPSSVLDAWLGKMTACGLGLKGDVVTDFRKWNQQAKSKA